MLWICPEKSGDWLKDTYLPRDEIGGKEPSPPVSPFNAFSVHYVGQGGGKKRKKEKVESGAPS